MVATCRRCASPLPGQARFCPQCGQAVLAAVATETRRVVTALFYDIAGSTRLAERLDPEDVQAVIGRAIDRILGAIESFGGTPRTPEGDGGMAVFGVPAVNEDDAERAVRAGLRIVSEVDAFSEAVERRQTGAGVAVRVGIETGLAAVGLTGGRGSGAVMGDAVNVAARLEAAAEPGTVLVGEQTHRLVADLFEWEGPRTLTLKGRTARLDAWLARAPRAGVRRYPGSDAAIVGRDEELARVHAAASEALSGSGRVVVLRGEAGMGKTRFVSELRRRFEAGGGRWLEGRGASYGADIALHPIADLLEGDPGAEDLLLAPEDVPPPLARERVFARVLAHFEGLARERPLALVLDDVHWADASSLALLHRLLDLPASNGMLLVLASRPDPEHGSAALLRAARSRAGVCFIELAGLAPEDEKSLLETLLGGGPIGDDVADRVLDRSGGNPLFLEELSRSLREQGESGRAATLADVPSSVAGIVLSRVDRLHPRDRSVLEAASVIGRQFDAQLLRTVTGSEELGGLLAADIVTPAGPGYGFRHPLLQQAVYDGLVRERRRELHSAAATALQGRAGVEPALVAYHYSAASDDAGAFPWHAAAAEAAEGRGALAEAATHATAALEAADRLGHDATDPRVATVLRRRWLARGPGAQAKEGMTLTEIGADLRRALDGSRAAGDVAGELAALVSLGHHVRSEDHTQTVEHLGAAAALAEQVGDEAVLASVLGRLSIAHSSLLDLNEASAVAQRAADAAQRAGTPAAQAAALDARKLVAFTLGQTDELEEVTGRLLVLLEVHQDLLLEQFTLLERSFAPLMSGDVDEARRRVDEAVSANARSGLGMLAPLMLDGHTWVERVSGDPDAAIAAGRRALAGAVATEMHEWIAWTAATLGGALLEAGEAEEARVVLSEGLEGAQRVHVAIHELRCSGLLSLASSRSGDRDAAASAAHTAQQVLARVRVPPGRALLYAADAQIALAAALEQLEGPGAGDAVAEPVLAAAHTAGWRIAGQLA